MAPTGDGRSGEGAGDEMRIVGTWRISEMELWDQEPIELMAQAFIGFGHDGTGRFRFIAVEGWMVCRYGHRDGRASAEFTWGGAGRLRSGQREWLGCPGEGRHAQGPRLHPSRR